MRKEIITQDRLKEALHYDPDTGIFTNRIDRYMAKKGLVSGCGTPSRGYIYMSIDGNLYAAHRLAFLYMGGEFPPEQVDHANHIRDDNRWCNISLATQKQNGMNLSFAKDNTSGITGVNWHKATNQWRAFMTIKKKYVHLGNFNDINDAIKARKTAEKEYGFHKNHGLPV